MYDLKNREVERHFVRTMYTCYADILLIILPFLVAIGVRVWQEEDFNLFQYPDIGMATCILAGMSIGRLLQTLIGDLSLRRYRLRFMLAISIILCTLVGPSLIHIAHSLQGLTPPDEIKFILPVLLLLSVISYSLSFNLHYLLNTVFSNENSGNSLAH